MSKQSEAAAPAAIEQARPQPPRWKRYGPDGCNNVLLQGETPLATIECSYEGWAMTIGDKEFGVAYGMNEAMDKIEKELKLVESAAAEPAPERTPQQVERFLGAALQTLDEIDLIIANIEGGIDTGAGILLKIAHELGQWKKEREKLQAAPDTGSESHEHTQVWSNVHGWVCTNKCLVCRAVAVPEPAAQPPIVFLDRMGNRCEVRVADESQKETLIAWLHNFEESVRKSERARQAEPAPTPSRRRFIDAEMALDGVKPYLNGPHPFIPYVVESDHPRFDRGTRFDYGFLSVALSEGYDVRIKAASDADSLEAVNAYIERKGDAGWLKPFKREG